MSPSNFKVIVVGGGPVGLTAAQALHRAGIDFVVLERRPHVVIDAGSNLVLSPVGLRAMSQLGLLEALNAVSSALGRIDRLDHAGRDLGDMEIFTHLERSLGMAPRVISRHDLTQVLFATLPAEAQQKVLSNKKLSTIIPTADGVTANCADGSSYEGSIIIGADGAHSLVRDLMRRLAVDSDSANVNAETPFLTTYRCLWVRFPKTTGVPVGTVCETHGPKAATQLFVGEDSGVVGVYERMDKPTNERIRYTQADQDALVERWGHLPVTPSGKLTLRDVYRSRLAAGLVSLEEGTVDHWSWEGRVVLTGDAAHKFTPSTGAGCNQGMIDIVVLVNELHAAYEASRVTSSNPDGAPGRPAIESAFKAYQDTRRDTVVSECAQAGQATATATWQSAIHKFVDRRIMSRHIVQKFLITQGAKSAVRTPAFDCASDEQVPNGSIPWAAPARALIQAH